MSIEITLFRASCSSVLPSSPYIHSSPPLLVPLIYFDNCLPLNPIPATLPLMAPNQLTVLMAGPVQRWSRTPGKCWSSTQIIIQRLLFALVLRPKIGYWLPASPVDITMCCGENWYTSDPILCCTDGCYTADLIMYYVDTCHDDGFILCCVDGDVDICWVSICHKSDSIVCYTDSNADYRPWFIGQAYSVPLRPLTSVVHVVSWVIAWSSWGHEHVWPVI